MRGTPSKRIFWRDRHAVTGIFVGFFIVFLVVTGMPWSSVWSGKVNEWANGNNFGFPAGVRFTVLMSDEHLEHIAKTSWSLEQAKTPTSPANHDPMSPIGPDEAVAKFDSIGLHRGYAVNIPTTPTGVLTVLVDPDDLSQQRIVHLNQYSRNILIDMGYADYGPLGKAPE